MNIEEERKAFESQECVKELLKFTGFSIESNQYYIKKNGLSQSGIEWLNGGWQMWQASALRAAKKLEGCVVVPVEPTQTMLDAFPEVEYEDTYCGTCTIWIDDITLTKGYKAMLEAARSGNE